MAITKKLYKPFPSLNDDQQLVPTPGRNTFCQYLLRKPDKFGIKLFWCFDAGTSYPLAGEIYVGRQPGQKVLTNVAHLVKRLI
ncbi:hypothetical protein T10_8227 [Trichinella papuae]|uniref:PiggyBac transposable element-derived protein domain-containing protein n=1 Tax=Trichinella papuae TaxID=268474 RepID=A0A0V1M2T9_9BILA|nr:hypothetical protein T10_8227 [Trichinella papuae]